MNPTGYFLVAGLAVCAGLDRTAVLQVMISRPIVAAPLTGLLLGSPQTGLLVGLLVELLWLCRLPVGAFVPPDDTQVSIGATVLAISMGEALHLGGSGFVILCTLLAMPLGKIGQQFDRLARHWNGGLVAQAEAALAEGNLKRAEMIHLWGLWHFALASLASFAVIIIGGISGLLLVGPLLIDLCNQAVVPLQLALPLAGIGVIVGSVKVKRSFTLFGASFGSALFFLWLL